MILNVRIRPVFVLLTLSIFSLSQISIKNNKHQQHVYSNFKIKHIPILSGAGGYDETTYQRYVRIRIPEWVSGKIKLYSEAKRIWMVPRHWILDRGVIGADGSTEIIFRPIKKSDLSYIRYENDGECAGCAMANASRFFASAEHNAKLSGLHFKGLPPHAFIERISHNTKIYKIRENNLNMWSLVYYSNNNDFIFSKTDFVFNRSDRRIMRFLWREYLRKHRG